MKTMTLVVSCMLLLFSQAAVGQTIKIHTHGGVSEFNLSDIDSITFVSSQADTTIDTTSNLILHMPFDGSVADVSGSGNNGSASNGQYVADRFGTPQSAYHFNGTDNPITIPNSPSLNPVDQLTIAFWLKVDSVAWNVSQLVSKTVDDVESQREYVVELKANYDYPYFKLWAGAPGDTTQELDAGAALVQQWHHLVFVVDRHSAHKMYIYLDGALSLSMDDTSGSFLSNTHPLYLGAGEGSWESTSVPDCSIDELRIYSRALSASEVKALFGLH